MSAAGDSNLSYALTSCFMLEGNQNLLQIKNWCMCYNTELTEAAKENKDYFDKLQFKIMEKESIQG